MRTWPSLTLGVLAFAAAAPVGSTARPPARLQVVEQEYRLTLSRLSVRSGPAIVNVVNFGQDPHDLVLVRSVRGSKPAQTKVVPPHGRAELDVRLAPGRYELYCSLPGHRAAGMRATLAVRRA
jgi:plastocyanin